MLIPTVPIINNGPELFVKLSKRSHSCFVKILFFLKFAAIVAPVGYPLITPIINAKLPSPDILNNGFINSFKNLPKIYGIFVCINNSVAIKKGNNDGTTDVAHNVNPVFAADKFVDENKTRHNANIKNISGKV